MNTLTIQEIDFLRQLESTLQHSDGDKTEVATEGALIRLRDCETEDRAKIELVAAERFPVTDYPEKFNPVADAITEFGYSFEDFDRSRSFYELTIER